ncbi:MAG TPA: hypothetical protein VIQ80_02880 [Candidatus Saccharimonadales bacterium]
MLSDATNKALQQAAAQENTYTPNGAVGKVLRTKHLIMFVGPAATGKSYLIHRIAEREPDFGRVPSFTTRDARTDDEPGIFQYIPHDDEHVAKLLESIKHGDVVQYAIHPTSGRIYGSVLAGFPKTYNMLTTLSNIVNHLRELPFAHTYVVGLVNEPDTWLQRFYERYPEPSGERTRRLREAVMSLEWLLAPENQNHIIWADTTEVGAENAIQAVIRAVKYNQHDGSEARKVAERMLERVKREVND